MPAAEVTARHVEAAGETLDVDPKNQGDDTLANLEARRGD